MKNLTGNQIHIGIKKFKRKIDKNKRRNKMTTDRMERIIEFLGEAVTTEEIVRQDFDGKTQAEILGALNEIYPTEDCETLASMIYEELN